LSLSFRVRRADPTTRARTGTLGTPRGEVPTPQFMPVGTRATVKGILSRDLREMGAQVLLANAFHLHLRPGEETIERLGGLHRVMAWEGPILTDSGGFQVFSLADARRVDEEGVSFRSPADGATVRLTPEGAVEIQRRLGSDLAMALDVCPGGSAGADELKEAVERTIRWAARCLEAHRRGRERGPAPALLGIVQGGARAELRERCAREIVAMGFDAYAIGGVSVGESKDAMRVAVEATTPHLPADLPRYLMGVGTPSDFVDAIERGVDLFDCVAPTREGRNGRAYTSTGVLNVRNASHAGDARPLDAACAGPCCREYSRGALRHFFHAGEMLGPILLSLHNVRFFLGLLSRAREAIDGGTFTSFAAEVRAVFPPNGGGEAKTA
jgi:queuine tRNA-ribosyltransferase